MVRYPKKMCEYARRWLIWNKMILLHEFDSMQNTWKLHANGFLRARQQETDLPSRSMLPATTIRTKALLYRFESADHCGFYDFLCHHICHAIWWYLRIFVYKCGVRMSTPLWSRACCQCRTSQAYHCVVAASREVWGWPGPMVCPNSKSYEECINLFCINANPMCSLEDVIPGSPTCFLLIVFRKRQLFYLPWCLINTSSELLF